MDIDWRAKIEALLFKAQANGTTKEESEALRERAAYLMSKYNIEDAVARHKQHRSELPINEEFKLFPPYANRKLDLIVVIANNLSGTVVTNGKSVAWVFAYKEDLERIKMLYFSLLAQMHIEQAVARVPVGVHGKTYKNSWLLGFIYGVSESLQRANRKAKNETPGSDVVLASSLANVNKAMRNQFPNASERASTSRITSDDGYDVGRATGRRADIGQNRVTSTNKTAIK